MQLHARMTHLYAWIFYSNTLPNTSNAPEPKAESSESSLVGGKTALGFGLGRNKTLNSIATDSSYRVIVGKFLLAI